MLEHFRDGELLKLMRFGEGCFSHSQHSFCCSSMPSGARVQSPVLPSSDRPLFYKSVAPNVFSKLTFYPRVDPNLFEMLTEALGKLLSSLHLFLQNLIHH